MKKFEVGKIYTYPGLHGPSFDIKVTSRNRESITFIEIEHPFAGSETAWIEYDDNGDECVLAWVYKGFHGYLRPNPIG